MDNDRFKRRLLVIFITIAHLLLFLLLFSSDAPAGTCSTVTRSNYAANSKLSSVALNADFNQILDAGSHGINDFDGGCVRDGTLEAGSLNTTDFAVPLNYLKEGCRVSYSDANTLSVGKCAAAVNGSYVRTTSANTVTWGCTGCSAEATGTTYYLYAKNGSASSTLNLLISTSAPNEDGYDSSSNLALARFYNESGGTIDQYSIDQWLVNRFIPTNSGWVTFTPDLINCGTESNVSGRWRRDGKDIIVYNFFTTGTTAASTMSVQLPANILVDSAMISSTYRNITGQMVNVNSGQVYLNLFTTFARGGGTDDSVINYSYLAASDTQIQLSNCSLVLNSGDSISLWYRVPVIGWSD